MADRRSTFAILLSVLISGPCFAQWLTQDPYPTEAAKAHGHGSATVAFSIDRLGHAQDCHITTSSEREDLDQASCALVLARARYQPGSGNDAEQYRTIHWIFPGETRQAADRRIGRGDVTVLFAPEPVNAGQTISDQALWGNLTLPLIRGLTSFYYVGIIGVDANGSMVSCETWQSSSDSRVDSAICDHLKRRGRFSPAKDAEGRNMLGFVQIRLPYHY